MHDVAYRIKELRTERGYTQQELSNISEVSRALIAGLESGAITETSTSTLKKLAKAFGIDVSDIFFKGNV